MSLASIHGPQFADMYPMGHSSLSVSSSLSDLVGSPLEISMDNVLTIEELRAQMGSCFSCGVSWTDDHVSLDCSECGGYSIERPCPLCDGKCGVQWKRDFTMSHACSKARWLGVCPSYPESSLNATTLLTAPSATTLPTNGSNGVNGSCSNNTASEIVAAVAAVAANANSTTNTIVCGTANQLLLAQELCARLEQLSASAQT